LEYLTFRDSSQRLTASEIHRIRRTSAYFLVTSVLPVKSRHNNYRNMADYRVSLLLYDFVTTENVLDMMKDFDAKKVELQSVFLFFCIVGLCECPHISHAIRSYVNHPSSYKHVVFKLIVYRVEFGVV